jgi:hypothetical protein
MGTGNRSVNKVTTGVLAKGKQTAAALSMRMEKRLWKLERLKRGEEKKQSSYL